MVELMVALTVGLLVVGSLMTIFVQSSRTNREMTQLVQQMENGRFAMQLLREDLWHAGFWGEYLPDASEKDPIPDPCTPYGTAWDPTYKRNFLALPIYGYSNAAAPGDTCGSVITNGKANTNVLVVRHASTCTSDAETNGNCEIDTPGKLYLQAPFCISQMSAIPYIMDTDSSIFTLTEKDCTTPRPKRKIISNIYYIDNNNVLRRSVLDLRDDTVKHQSSQALIEGIERMEIEYGIDSIPATKGDGIPDIFDPNPTTRTAWENVVAVKVYLLARAPDPSPGYVDSKVYQFGSKPPFTPTGDDRFYKRHVYSTYVRLINLAGRRDTP